MLVGFLGECGGEWRARQGKIEAMSKIIPFFSPPPLHLLHALASFRKRSEPRHSGGHLQGVGGVNWSVDSYAASALHAVKDTLIHLMWPTVSSHTLHLVLPASCWTLQCTRSLCRLLSVLLTSRSLLSRIYFWILLLFLFSLPFIVLDVGLPWSFSHSRPPACAPAGCDLTPDLCWLQREDETDSVGHCQLVRPQPCVT